MERPDVTLVFLRAPQLNLKPGTKKGAPKSTGKEGTVVDRVDISTSGSDTNAPNP